MTFTKLYGILYSRKEKKVKPKGTPDNLTQSIQDKRNERSHKASVGAGSSPVSDKMKITLGKEGRVQWN